MPVPTGSPGFDRLLGGGLPEERTTLVTGGPGTGKSTLAMQFLQEGLRHDESCLFISTEQTHAELVDSFAPFEFDLDHDALDIVTVQAVPGRPVEHDESMLALSAPEDHDENRPLDFTSGASTDYFRAELEPYAPRHRVVLDSVSGLAAMASDLDQYRRSVLELIRFLADRFNATSLFTSERGRPTPTVGDIAGFEALKYSAHAVVDMRREKVRGDVHRFVNVEKLRGRAHDARDHEFDITPTGIEVFARRPARPETPLPTVPTGVEGLDDLLGGGVVEGGTALLEHDGRANLLEMVARLVETAVDEGFVVPFTPSVNMSPERLDPYFTNQETAQELIDDDRLFVFDAAGVRDPEEYNVFHVEEGPEDVQEAALKVDEKRDEEPLYYVINTEALLHAVTPQELRDLRYWARMSYLTPQDTALFMHYPKMIDQSLAEFFVDDAGQVMETWLRDDGLQYVALEKGPQGNIGGSRFVEFTEDAPFVRIRQSASVDGPTDLDGFD